MAEINRYKVCVGDITQGGAACKNPTIKWESNSEYVIIPCKDSDCNCVEIEVYNDENVDIDKCFNLIIDCEDCEKCPPQIITKCLCDKSSECDGCSTCIDGFCEDNCPQGTFCNEQTDTCVDCRNNDDCPDSMQCSGGTCSCPPNKPFLTDEGVCVACQTSSDCGSCETCVNNGCVPIDCPTGVCNPETEECQECLGAGDCGPNQICTPDGTCDCAPGYVYDPSTQTCIEEPECNTDGDCGACSVCVSGECTPIVCPDGKICVNGICETLCDCNDPQCAQGGCSPVNSSICICKECTGTCDDNFDCAQGCACVDGQCQTNECSGACNSGSDCGPGCGCFEGMCYPCETLSCEDESCGLAYGCECQGGNCAPSACGNPCGAHNDCAFGCFCDGEDQICKSCSELTCNNGECAQQVGCQCVNGDCVADDEQLFRCKPASTQSIEGCIEVALMIDASGSMHPYGLEVRDEANAFANAVLNVSSDSKLGYLTYAWKVKSQVPLSSNPGYINFQINGCTNYTDGLDKAIGMLANSSACKKYIVFFTDGKQNTAHQGPFPNTGLDPSGAYSGNCGSNDPAAEDNLAIQMGDYARSQGIEIRTIAYGPLVAPASNLLAAISGGIQNVFPAPAYGSSQGFNDVLDNITTVEVVEAGCIPAELSWTGETFNTSENCEETCGTKYYECTPNGCVESATGTLTAAECVANCNPDTYCDCTGGECTPTSDGSGIPCSSCTDACACGSFTADISYSCDENRVVAVISGGSGSGFTADLTDEEGNTTTHNMSNLQTLSLPEGSYTVVITDNGNTSCRINESFDVSCCSDLSVSGIDVSVCGEGQTIPVEFEIINGSAPYTYEIYKGVSGLPAPGSTFSGTVLCSGTLNSSGDDTSSNSSCVDTISNSTQYGIVATDANGCKAYGILNATVNEGFDISATGYQDICATASTTDVVFTHTSVNHPYTWELKRGTAVVVNATNSDTSLTYTESSVSNGILYTLKVTDSEGCETIDQFTLNTVNCASCIVSASDQTWCGNEPKTIVAAVSNGTAPYNYEVTIDADPNHPNNTSGTLSADGNIEYIDNVSTDHTVTFDVTDVNGQTCNVTINATVTEYTGDLQIICLNCHENLCVGDTANFIANGGFTGGTTSWYVNQPPGSGTVQGTGSAFSVVLDQANISVCAVNEVNNCTSNVACAVVSDGNCSACDLQINGFSESGNDLTVNTTGCAAGPTYTWVASNGGAISSGNGTATITTNGTGDYQVTVECTSGVQQPCQAVSTYTMTPSGPCDISMTVDTSTPCQIIVNATPTNCTGSLEYRLINNLTGQIFGWQNTGVFLPATCCGAGGNQCDPCSWTADVRCSNDLSCQARTMFTTNNCVG